MDFTREPIIETVITPKEGCKLVVRSSKNTAQEEYFVDAIEVVSFGHSFFFRSMERPKAFLVPVSDYEVLEVREARMVLKNIGIDRTIKIGGGRDAQMRGSAQRESAPEKVESSQPEEYVAVSEQNQSPQAESKNAAEPRLDKKRDRRRQYRRRRGREDGSPEGGASEESSSNDNKETLADIELPEPRKVGVGEESIAQPITTTSILTSLLPPPPTLISETIARYKDNALFRGAFYSKEESKPLASEDKEEGKEGDHLPTIQLEQPEYGSFEVSEEEEERIYQLRKHHAETASENVLEERESSEEVEVNTLEPIQDAFLDVPVESRGSVEDSLAPTEISQPVSDESETKNENHSS